MSTPNNNQNNRRRRQHNIQTIRKIESIISNQVFANRRNEIHEYLKLFGYKPDKTIIQVTYNWIQEKKVKPKRKRTLHTRQQKSMGELPL